MEILLFRKLFGDNSSARVGILYSELEAHPLGEYLEQTMNSSVYKNCIEEVWPELGGLWQALLHPVGDL